MASFKVDDKVRLTSKMDSEHALWVPEMYAYINNEFTIEYVYTSTVKLRGKNWFFPFDVLELVEDPQVKEKDVPQSFNPVSPKVVYVRHDVADETYETEKEALIEYFDEKLRGLINFRGNFNIMHVLENASRIIDVLNHTQEFNLLVEDKQS